MAAPIWFLLYLTTSPLAKSPARSQSSDAVRIPLAKLAFLPVALIISFVIPSLLLVLPAPAAVSVETHQKLIALWQPFPIYNTILVFVLSKLYSPSSAAPSSEASRKEYLESAEKFYTFLLTFAAITHIPALLLTQLPPETFLAISPEIVSRIQNSVIPVSFSTVYVPRPPLPSWKAISLADGIHTFLHWDTYVSSAAALVWVLVLRSKAGAGDGSSGLSIGSVIKYLALVALTGPFGLLAYLMWEREETLVEVGKVKDI